MRLADLRVAVLGAGLQGTCVAMDLASAGIHVDLYDRNSACMTQASLHNEGKIHLGYVYANDRSLRSAEMMINGAAAFGPLLEAWLGLPMSAWRQSTQFNYAVHRDSLLTPLEFEDHLHRTHDLVGERIGRGAYFGVDFGRPPVRLSPQELEAHYDPTTVQAVYRTNEISIDPQGLASAVRDRVAADSMICSMFDREVHGVRSDDDRVAVEFTNGGEQTTVEYDHVVNALWDGRLAVDATVGLAPERPWLYRVKHYMRLRSSGAGLPSTTIVLGPFGDIVDYGNGALFLSWYPSGLQGSSSELRLPTRLRSLPADAVPAVRAGIVDGLATVMPRLAELPAADLAAGELAGGVIFAWGATDIDDIESGLHNRFAVGPRTVGRYHSVDTGKLTMAPLFARMVGERIRTGR